MPNVATIGEYAFYECSSLASVEMSNVTYIKYKAFADCSSLISIEILKDTDIEESVFYGCSSLTSVEMPNVTYIRKQTFYECSKLTSVEIPNVTDIGDYAFYYCINLKSIYLPKATTIGEAAFSYCNRLISVEIPNVTYILYQTFYYCRNLISVDMPNVTYIGEYAFAECVSLTSVDMPKITFIRQGAFAGCISLTSIYFFGDAPTINNSAIPNYSLLTVYYPENSTDWETQKTIYSRVNWVEWDANMMVVRFTITEESTGSPISGATVTVVNSNTQGKTNMNTDEDGTAFFELVSGRNYTATVTKGSGEYSQANTEFLVEHGKGVQEISLTLEALPNVKDEYTIIFNANAGEDIVTGMPESIIVIEDEDVILPTSTTPVRKGYSFVGWLRTSSGNIISSIPKVAEDITVYAIWAESPVFILGDINGDGVVDGLDVIAITRYTVGFNDGLGIGFPIE